MRSALSDAAMLQRVNERLFALGNVIACNDYVALAHPDVNRETGDTIVDVLKVEVLSIFSLPAYCGSAYSHSPHAIQNDSKPKGRAVEFLL